MGAKIWLNSWEGYTNKIVIALLHTSWSQAPAPLDFYRTLTTGRLGTHAKWMGVITEGIGETLLRDPAKIILRAAVYHAKVACGNLHIFSGILAGIEVYTHTLSRIGNDRDRKT